MLYSILLLIILLAIGVAFIGVATRKTSSGMTFLQKHLLSFNLLVFHFKTKVKEYMFATKESAYLIGDNFRYRGDLNVEQTVHQFIGDTILDVGDDLIGDVLEGDLDGDDLTGDDMDGDPIVFDVGDEMGDTGTELGDSKRKRRKRKVRGVKKWGRKARAKRTTRATNLIKAERAASGKLNVGDYIPFISGRNLTILSVSAIPNDAKFECSRAKFVFDAAATETPGIMQVVTSSTPSTLFTTAFGATEYYIYPFFIIKLGVAALSGIANQTIVITLQIPLKNGTAIAVTINAQIQGQFDATLTVWPWTTVQGKPVFVQGKVGGSASTTADEIQCTITGLPSGAVASIVLPLSEHPVFKGIESMLP